MNSNRSAVLFNRSLLWLILAKMADNEFTRGVLLLAAAVAVLSSAAEAWEER